jgi:hypothetical protein
VAACIHPASKKIGQTETTVKMQCVQCGHKFVLKRTRANRKKK